MQLNLPHNPLLFSRRDCLRSLSGGFGYLAFSALSSMAAETSSQGVHFPAKAKRVIMIFMQGGVSHVDTFDYKPQLQQDDGQRLSKDSGAKLMGSPWKFSRHGESGQWISELFPHLARRADDLCVLTAMRTDPAAHETAVPMFHTGNQFQVRPAMGAWVLYGLGSESANLPGFIAMNPLNNFGSNHASGFLPAVYQAAMLRAEADPPVPNLACNHLSSEQQSRQLELLQRINQRRLARDVVNSELEAVIESYEMGFRMQTAVPSLMDFGSESQETLEMYGINSGNRRLAAFARQCLLARRFAEEGVRFIEIGSGGWDHHKELKASLTESALNVDQPLAALLTDLKQRDLLEDTLVIWATEFGRTPTAQFDNGRDHNNRGFTIWLAGGGVKPGHRHGVTDEYGREGIEGRVHIHDLHATILHLLGLDHKRLTYHYSGRDFRLTDVYGNVVQEILA